MEPSLKWLVIYISSIISSPVDQKYRSGTRFYNRGIDENSKCSQFIETEQIIVLGTQLLSFVCLSGSAPLFWEQKSQSDKIRLTRNK